MTRFLFIFITVVSVLFGLEILKPVQVAVIEPWTSSLARMSAWLMTMFDADVISQGRVLFSQRTGMGVSIEAGCNGVEAAIILIGAMTAFPAP